MFIASIVSAEPSKNTPGQYQLDICSENLKKLAQALHEFARHNGGHFPAKIELLVPFYLKELPHCPTAVRNYEYWTRFRKGWKDDVYELSCPGYHPGILRGYPRIIRDERSDHWSVTVRKEPAYLSEQEKLNYCEENLNGLARAIAAYSLAHDGEPPKSLDALIPDYITEIPICPAASVFYQYNRKGPNDYSLSCPGHHRGIERGYPMLVSGDLSVEPVPPFSARLLYFIFENYAVLGSIGLLLLLGGATLYPPLDEKMALKKALVFGFEITFPLLALLLILFETRWHGILNAPIAELTRFLFSPLIFSMIFGTGYFIFTNGFFDHSKNSEHEVTVTGIETGWSRFGKQAYAVFSSWHKPPIQFSIPIPAIRGALNAGDAVILETRKGSHGCEWIVPVRKAKK